MRTHPNLTPDGRWVRACTCDGYIVRQKGSKYCSFCGVKAMFVPNSTADEIEHGNAGDVCSIPRTNAPSAQDPDPTSPPQRARTEATP